MFEARLGMLWDIAVLLSVYSPVDSSHGPKTLFMVLQTLFMVRRLFFINIILDGQRATGLDSSTSPSMARLTPGLSTLTSTSMARFTPGLYAFSTSLLTNVHWQDVFFQLWKTRPIILVFPTLKNKSNDIVVNSQPPRWASSSVVNIIVDWCSSTSLSTASIRAGLVFSVDIVVDGQPPCWTLII